MSKKRGSKGIFCIEGDWWEKAHRQSSMEPILELLSKWDTHPVPYVRRDVATRAEFDHYLAQATQNKFKRFPIIYFALHGSRGTLLVADGRRKDAAVDIREIAQALEGRCAGKVLYFSSCETLDVHGNELRGILKRTKAKAVCGYCASVDWLDAAAFDTLLLGQFQCNAMTRTGLKAVRHRIRTKAASLAKHLRFSMVIA